MYDYYAISLLDFWRETNRISAAKTPRRLRAAGKRDEILRSLTVWCCRRINGATNPSGYQRNFANFQGKNGKNGSMDYENCVFTIPLLEDPLKKSELSIYDVRNLMDFNAIFLRLVCVAGYRLTQAFKSTAFLTNNESLSSIFLRHLVQQKTCHVTCAFASRRFLVDKSKRTLKLGAQKSLLRWLFANQLVESWFHPQTRQDKMCLKTTCKEKNIKKTTGESVPKYRQNC